jgi:hypothetical protein
VHQGPAPQGGGRSFVAGAGAVLGLGAIGVDLATRERVRAYAESELTFGFYLFDDVGVPVAKWPTLAVLPIAVLVGVIGFRERREPSDDD